MHRGGIRASVWISVAGFLIMLAAVVVVLESRRPRDAAVAAISGAVEGEKSLDDAKSAARLRLPALQAPNRSLEQEPVPYIENLVWGEIDLREAQAVMPDNLYWQWGAPTSDPDELAAREEEKRRRNEEYGRVLSGDASEEEVKAYYDYRERLSSDYLEFAQWMRNRHGDGLSEQFRGLLDLSIKLNAARLAQIPVDRERSLEHSRTRAEVRADWQRQQEEFGTATR